MVYVGVQYGRQVKEINLQAYALVGLGTSRFQYSEDYTEKDTDVTVIMKILFGI